MFDTTAGNILIDGIDLKHLNLNSYRQQLGYVPQDIFLFSDTIYNNIAFGSVKSTSEEVEEAARQADLFQNIQELPEKFETKVGERGITLSGGQKQRVSIARAIMRKPKIMIMDDALSAVDTKTENSILQSMEKAMKGRTTIIISHRISSAKLADTIIVLDNGRIIESGSNEELLNRNGIYRELYDKQLAVEELI
jgi:ATP-binding cassette subfamily B multidrug efflux pump